MSTHKNIDKICVAVLIVTLLLTILFMNGESLGIEKIVDEDSETYSGSAYFTANDENTDIYSSSATVITLSGTEATISGSGAYAYDDGVVIKNAGIYTISGTLTDGSITVDAYSSSKVFILLNGVDVTCSDSAAFYIMQADKVFLTLAEGTENSFTSGASYSAEALSDGADGAVFAHDDLTINGSGSLAVNAGYQHGISANDDLVITGGTINVTAPADGIRANDSLRLKNADISVTAGDDGLVANAENAYLYVQSGTYTVNASDDAIHTAGDITIDGGSFTITAGDDGIHSDTAFIINNGTLLIEDCYEGIEALTITVAGGDITIYPSDDGFNANGNTGSMMGQSSSSATVSVDDTWLRISGGTITIINESGNDADGLDSNGSIYITDGSIRISLVGTGSNSAIDYGSESGGVCEISGGDIIACGSYSMAEGFDSSSTQASILYNTSTGAEAGSTFSLEDADGNVLITWDVPCSYSSVNVSCPDLVVGETYTVVIGDNVEEITLEETAASYGDAASSMFGGNMFQGGGMQSRGGGHSGGHGGGANFGGRSDSSDASGAEAPGMGDMSGMEMPEMPSGTGDMSGFERPEMGDMSGMTPPDMGDMSGMTPPDMGDMSGMTPPDMGGMSGAEMPGGMGNPEAEQQTESTSTASAAEETTITYTAESYLTLGAAAVVLILGLIFAIGYKRRS